MHNRVPLRLCSFLALTAVLGGCSGGCSVGTVGPSPITPTAPITPLTSIKGKFAYTGNQGQSLSGYAVNFTIGTTGALTPQTVPSIPSGIAPFGISITSQ